ncbi:MAG TPA: SMC-Scp complex subunit ScpB [Phycisphaerae bacterium]|nr:SMC-Scp complex subunit ScpB [Phycisphaerae bacterium]HRW55533.1 SMC-Scp complex subunit ScpB [Phycisphaerae bacterium]
MDGGVTLTETDPTNDTQMPEDANQPESAPDTEATTAADADATPQTAAETPVEATGPDAEPKRVVEAVLMAAESPLTAGKIASIIETGSGKDVKKHIETLNADYEAIGLSFRIEEVAGGFQILTQPLYNHWLTKLLRVRQETKLSPAAMETLAIVAYKQPCTRAEVEAIRGVAAGEMINRLREMNIIKIVGRAEDLGRPLLYGTTKKFLEVFGLPSLDDLPQVEALRPPPAKAKETVEESTTESEPPAPMRTDDIPETIDDDQRDVDGSEDADATPSLHIVHDEEDEAAAHDEADEKAKD